MRYIKEATTTGTIISPFGRRYTFQPKVNWRGETVWSENDIVNWPNQGCGADVMAIARVAAHSRAKRAGMQGKLVNTIHDSIVADVPEREQTFWVEMFDKVFRDLPKLIEQAYAVPWNVPMIGEVSIGNNMSDLTEVKVA